MNVCYTISSIHFVTVVKEMIHIFCITCTNCLHFESFCVAKTAVGSWGTKQHSRLLQCTPIHRPSLTLQTWVLHEWLHYSLGVMQQIKPVWVLLLVSHCFKPNPKPEHINMNCKMRGDGELTAHLVRFCCCSLLMGGLVLFINLYNREWEISALLCSSDDKTNRRLGASKVTWREKRSADWPTTLSYLRPSAANPAIATTANLKFTHPKTFGDWIFQSNYMAKEWMIINFMRKCQLYSIQKSVIFQQRCRNQRISICHFSSIRQDSRVIW